MGMRVALDVLGRVEEPHLEVYREHDIRMACNLASSNWVHGVPPSPAKLLPEAKSVCSLPILKSGLDPPTYML
jgi:hypothetical protein